VFLVILLLLALLGFSSVGSSHNSGTATATAPTQMRLAFTIDGRPVDARGQAPPLRPGQVLRFALPVRAFTLQRLECRNDTRTVRLDAQRRWRVPADVPSRLYTMRGRGANFSFRYSIRVESRPAPCGG
jgi:hypothetical protein